MLEELAREDVEPGSVDVEEGAVVTVVIAPVAFVGVVSDGGVCSVVTV